MKWTNRDGKEIPLEKLDNAYLVQLMNRFYRLAYMIKESTVALYEASEGLLFRQKALLLEGTVWTEFVDDMFFDLEYEAARRSLGWKPPEMAFDQRVALLPRGSLDRRILGALRKTINAHGPITKDFVPSATKRIIGAIKTFNNDLEK